MTTDTKTNPAPWALYNLPPDLPGRIKAAAALKGMTIGAYLEQELAGVAERLEKDPEAFSPELPAPGETTRWNVKGVSDELRSRLKALAGPKGAGGFHDFIVQELTAIVEEAGL